MSLENSQILQNRYQIERLIGQGGFGAVYLAIDLRLKRVCVVKENSELSLEGVHQFEKEAILLANLNHPNLPRVTDHFVIKQQGQYLVMDFIEGQNIHQLLLDEMQISEQQALVWVKQICDALEYLHNYNPPIIHRDIKPANIIITPSNKAMLVDFGLSKIHTDNNQSTSFGSMGGTPGFSPPEQYSEKKRTDSRSDIYALGATLYVMLTYSIPPNAIERLVSNAILPNPLECNPNITPQVSNAIIKAMQLEPSHRFQTITEFKDKLKERVQPLLSKKNMAPASPQLSPQPSPRQLTGLAQLSQRLTTELVKKIEAMSNIELAVLTIGLIILFGLSTLIFGSFIQKNLPNVWIFFSSFFFIAGASSYTISRRHIAPFVVHIPIHLIIMVITWMPMLNVNLFFGIIVSSIVGGLVLGGMFYIKAPNFVLYPLAVTSAFIMSSLLFISIVPNIQSTLHISAIGAMCIGVLAYAIAEIYTGIEMSLNGEVTPIQQIRTQVKSNSNVSQQTIIILIIGMLLFSCMAFFAYVIMRQLPTAQLLKIPQSEIKQPTLDFIIYPNESNSNQSIQQRIANSLTLWDNPKTPTSLVLQAYLLPNTPALLNLGWCASDQNILDNNWSYLHYSLFMDNEQVILPEPWTTNNCRGYTKPISGWGRGQHNFVWFYKLDQTLNDGKNTYQAGEYKIEVKVTVQ